MNKKRFIDDLWVVLKSSIVYLIYMIAFIAIFWGYLIADYNDIYSEDISSELKSLQDEYTYTFNEVSLKLIDNDKFRNIEILRAYVKISEPVDVVCYVKSIDEINRSVEIDVLQNYYEHQDIESILNLLEIECIHNATNPEFQFIDNDLNRKQVEISKVYFKVGHPAEIVCYVNSVTEQY
ncbi:MAG: hypothetical protein OXI67_09920 [Candidatus Poribacteria bacterium]|nr:hypothetical protein [Candidatus Poribacteria bacterium]